jgi:hypothetical protein
VGISDGIEDIMSKKIVVAHEPLPERERERERERKGGQEKTVLINMANHQDIQAAKVEQNKRCEKDSPKTPNRRR